MLVTKILLRNSRSIPILQYGLARKKDKKDEVETVKRPDQFVKIQQVKIDTKEIDKTAALYDQYLKTRQKTMLTLDNYRVRFVLILQRPPIFVPFHSKKFQYYKTKYQYLKKTGYYPQIPKQLQVETGDYLFAEYERVNPQNQVSHRNVISKTEIYEYSENSRYWRYTDPTITDPKSIQTYSSQNVFLIVKNNSNGKWEFPGRVLTEKDNHKEIFTVINNQLFSGSPNSIVHIGHRKPVFARTIQDEQISDRGQGVNEYFFKGLALNGIPKFPTQNYAEYAWVPKPLLGEYFQDQYYKDTIKLTVHIC